MSVEIPCPGCRFPFRADDEFAGESAPCPHCGAKIAVPNPETRGITRKIGQRIPARDERVRLDPREANAFPAHLHLPIPQHGEPRPIELVEPDEDHPLNEGGYWPFGPMVPRGPRMRALYEVCCSTTRVTSLLAEPLKRLRPLYVLLSSILGWLVLFGGVAYWLWDELPYLALVVSFAGCLVIRVGAKHLLAMSATGLPLADADENSTSRQGDDGD
jgi:hypothetical protein